MAGGGSSRGWGAAMAKAQYPWVRYLVLVMAVRRFASSVVAGVIVYQRTQFQCKLCRTSTMCECHFIYYSKVGNDDCVCLETGCQQGYEKTQNQLSNGVVCHLTVN